MVLEATQAFLLYRPENHTILEKACRRIVAVMNTQDLQNVIDPAG